MKTRNVTFTRVICAHTGREIMLTTGPFNPGRAIEAVAYWNAIRPSSVAWNGVMYFDHTTGEPLANVRTSVEAITFV